MANEVIGRVHPVSATEAQDAMDRTARELRKALDEASRVDIAGRVEEHLRVEKEKASEFDKAMDVERERRAQQEEAQARLEASAALHVAARQRAKAEFAAGMRSMLAEAVEAHGSASAEIRAMGHCCEGLEIVKDDPAAVLRVLEYLRSRYSGGAI